MLSGVVAIVCYLSLNPSPTEWLLSGPKGSLAELESVARATAGAEVLDRATGESFDFIRLRFAKTILYGDYMNLMNVALPSDVLGTMPAPTIPNCPPEGRLEDVGNPHAPVDIGVFGSAQALALLREQNSWARFSDVTLNNGRTGLRFTPSSAQADSYSRFVSEAADGEYEGVEIVILNIGSATR